MFRSRKNYTVATNQSGLLFPCFPSSPRVFCVRIYFFTGENSDVFFFACCFWLTFGFGPFPAEIMLLCLRLLLESIIPWFSPSPLYFSCPFIFFYNINLFTGFAVLLLCFLLCCFGRAAEAFFVFSVILSAS